MLTLEEKVTKKALYQIYKTSGFGIGGQIIVLLLIALLLSGKVSANIIISGLILHIVIFSVRAYTYFQYSKNIQLITDTSSLSNWLSVFQIGAFMTGLAWGIMLFFLSELPAEYYFLIYAVIIGLASSGVVALGVAVSVYTAFMLPMLGSIFIWMLPKSGFIYSISTFLIILIVFYNFISARRFSQNFRQILMEKATIKEYAAEVNSEHSALQRSEQLNRKLNERTVLALSGSGTSILDWDFTDNSIYISPSWKEMLGFGNEELPNTILVWNQRVHQDDINFFYYSLEKHQVHKVKNFENTHRLKHKDGHWIWVLGRAQILYDANGKAVRMVGIYTDITEEKEMQLNYAHQVQIIDNIHDAVMSTDLSGVVTSWSKGLELLCGYKADEMIGNDLAGICSEEGNKALKKSIETLIQKGRHGIDIRLVRKSKEVIYVNLSLSPLKDKKGELEGMMVYAQDITERKKAEEKLLEQKNVLYHQAHYDHLTDLPNRILLNDRLEESIKKAKRERSKLALLFIDLDHFKQINDSLGHEVGDRVLQAVAHRLKGGIQKVDTLARLGGDEFVIIIENLAKVQDASHLAQKMLEILKQPIYVDDYELYVSGSIGISLHPENGENAHNLLKYADTAMYKAKDEGRNNFQFYSVDMTEVVFERVAMEVNLRQALQNKEFVVYYQPQIDASTQKIIGVEALVRWRHPINGLISPVKFIPLAEETGLIIEIDRLVMKMAMRQVSRWYKAGFEPGVLALNLAMKQLKQSDFLQMIQDNFEALDFKPEWLELEITEGDVMQKPEEAIYKLKQINDLGIKIAIDDFGTGYSSLSYLKRLPIDKLKIDQSFVKDIPENDEDVAIVKAIIVLAKSLNLDLLGEGVETEAQKDFLLANGCRNIQGYYYARPMPSGEMEIYMQN